MLEQITDKNDKFSRYQNSLKIENVCIIDYVEKLLMDSVSIKLLNYKPIFNFGYQFMYSYIKIHKMIENKYNLFMRF